MSLKNTFGQQNAELASPRKRHKRGDVRDDGMVFCRYASNCKNGEHWVTPEKLLEVKERGRKANNERRRRNPDEAVKKCREWWLNNKEKARQACRNWYNRNREKRKQDWIEWYAKNPDRNKIQYSRNAAEIRKRCAERRKNDPVYAITSIIRNRIKAGFASKELPKRSKTEQIIKCSWVHLKNHVESLFLDNMSWDNRGKWHVDHIVPLNIAKTESEVIALNHWTNLRPLWSKENFSKGHKLPDTLPDYIDSAVRDLWIIAKSQTTKPE